MKGTASLDHLVVATTSLEAGTEWFEALGGPRLANGGSHPRMGTLIEWPSGIEAAARMDDHGLRLEALRVIHPDPARMETAFAAIGAASLVELGSGRTRIAATLVHDGGVLTL